MVRRNQAAIKRFLVGERHLRIAAILPRLFLNVAKIEQGQPGEMRPQIGQELVAEFAMRDEHGVRLPAVDEVAHKARIVRRSKKMVQAENIGRQVERTGPTRDDRR